MLPAIIIYMVVRSIAKGAKVATEEARREAQRRARMGGSGDAAAGTSVGANDLMRELQKVLEESRRVAEGQVPTQLPPRQIPAPRPAVRRQPVTVLPAPRRPETQVRVVKGEDGVSLEVSSTEPVSLDAEAEAIIARRRAEVEKRNAELAGEHHDRFDKRIRTAKPVQAAAAPKVRMPAGGLREAFIWSEVLGKPVGLR